MNEKNKNARLANSNTPTPFKIKKPSTSEIIEDAYIDGYELKTPKRLNDIMNSKNINNDKLIDPKKIMKQRIEKE